MQSVNYVYEQNIERPNRGWVVNKLSCIHNEDEIGYLKISYIPAANFSSVYKSIFDYMTKIQGWCLTKKEGYNPDLHSVLDFYSQEEICKLQSYIYRFGYDKPKLNFDEFETIVKERYDRDYKSFVYYHIDHPMVDYVFVEPEYRRQGIGTNLYILGNQHCKEQGLCSLRSSSLQSKEAEAVWKIMLDKGLAIVRVLPEAVQYRDQRKFCPVMR